MKYMIIINEKEYTLRPIQKKWRELFRHNNQKNIMLKALTGSGKSIAAMQFHQNHDDQTIIITQSIKLQEQYNKEFNIPILKGRGNFICNNSWDHETHKYKYKANNEKTICHKTKQPCGEHCDYMEHKKYALSKPIFVTNYAYFLLDATNNNTINSIEKTLVFDEAHSLIENLLKFNTTELNSMLTSEIDDFNFKDLDTEIDIEKHLLRLKRQINHKILEHKTDLEDPSLKEDYGKIELKNTKLKNYKEKIDFILNHLADNNYKYEYITGGVNKDGRTNYHGKGKYDKIVFTPLRITEEIRTSFKGIIGQHNLYMSATLNLRDMKNKLMLPDTYYQSYKSVIPPEQRPIIIDTVGKMSFKHKEYTLPKMLNKIRDLLCKYPDKKGVIHTHSYSLAGILYNELHSEYDDRLLTHNGKNRDSIISEYMSNPSNNTVLISPFAYTGISLDDDLCRFQIIAKVPFPNLGDKEIQQEIENDGWTKYYKRCAEALEQAYGRGIRNHDDYCDCYILDGSIISFISRNKKFLSEYFMDGVRAGKKVET